VEDEDEFVHAVLEGQPEPPKYFAEMKRINKEGPRVLGGMRRPQRLPESRLAKLLQEGALVIDARPAGDYAIGHIPGTLNIPLNRGFTTWAGWLIPYDRDFYLLLDDGCGHCIDEAVKDLAMIGLDRVSGYFGLSAVEQWRAGGRQLETVQQIGGDELARGLERGEIEVIDVRGAAEWEAGHIPGVSNIPVGYLTDRLDTIPRDRPVAVLCQGGGRSAIASSVLQVAGVNDVLNFPGGFAEWQASGKPVERGAMEAAHG
jgi:hydroxyacylglutathione hydrolase